MEKILVSAVEMTQRKVPPGCNEPFFPRMSFMTKKKGYSTVRIFGLVPFCTYVLHHGNTVPTGPVDTAEYCTVRNGTARS